ncbi:MAG: NAD(P)-dependent oxidoreductase [Clostridia bacterium]|jgi:3-hydroxyisobutyrate dehydrogenase|nr:NAD(P)-dependent oxidoreductase [Clostridia bacterium]
MITKEAAIGFVGIGVMGKSMVLNLMKAGFNNMRVYTRTKSKAEEVIARGAQWKDTVSQLAREADVVITMVGYPKDVEELYLGENGIINSGKEGAYLIDMTTSSPNLAKRIYQEAAQKGMKSLDAPVSGGDIGAREGRLSIMVGGDAEAFQAVKPLFEAMGNNIILQGGPGSGQYTKMCNQITIASNMIGVCEALAYGVKAGLDPRQMLKSIETGAAASWSLSNLVPRMLAEDYSPGFYVKHFIKDMNIALESAQEMGLQTPGLELAKSLYDKLAQMGEENSGTQALYKLYL